MNRAFCSVPSWRTEVSIGRTTPCIGLRNQDLAVQLERSPHLPHIASPEKIVEQMGRIADALEQNWERFPLTSMRGDEITHVYLRHGTTWKPFGMHSDVDLLVLGNKEIEYGEQRRPWVQVDGYPRDWHIGFDSLDSLLRGQFNQQKTDLFRGVCLFGDDIYKGGDRPSPLMWMHLADQLFKWAGRYAFDIDNFPADYWPEKAKSRITEVEHILIMLCPRLQTGDLDSIIGKSRTVEVLMDPSQAVTDFITMGIEMLWDTYQFIANNK